MGRLLIRIFFYRFSISNSSLEQAPFIMTQFLFQSDVHNIIKGATVIQKIEVHDQRVFKRFSEIGVYKESVVRAIIIRVTSEGKL